MDVESREVVNDSYDIKYMNYHMKVVRNGDKWFIPTKLHDKY